MSVHDRLNHLTRAAVESLTPLPSQPGTIHNDRYAVQHSEEDSVAAYDIEVASKIWFKSPALNAQTIRRIRGLKLFAESHDQGFCDEEIQGNWTWVELVVLENESATSPKKDPDGQELVAISHPNKLGSDNYEWLLGNTFDKSRDLLRFLEAGNVIAVRICARFTGWEFFARDGYLVFDIGGDNDPVPIIPIPVEKADSIPRRRSVFKWFEEAQKPSLTALELSLFIRAMTKFQQLPPEDQLSYFRIAGIHSYPSNVSWNMGKEPIPYDAKDMEQRMEKHDGGDYCPHNNFVFPTWHRAYMMLFERRVSDLMLEEAKTRGKEWVQAAKRWRLPYWDWAAEPRLPDLMLNKNITIIDSWDGVSPPTLTPNPVPNPMYSFQMPGGKPMGDESHGDYRIDGNEDGPWDLCIGTSRHAISYYDEKRLWVEGNSDAEKVRKALQGPLTPRGETNEKLTLKDAVFRLLTHTYSTKYEHFASTKHKPKILEAATGYLSLESIHNSVHNYTGGNNVAAGCGHMSSVPVAAFDPIFWLHHCNIDRLLHLWQCFNPHNWFITQDGRDGEKEKDGSRTDLLPFHRSREMNDFYNSDRVRYATDLNYTYDDMEFITDEDGEILPEKRNEYINDLYGPGHLAFKSPSKDVDPIINVVYDRYAFNGLSYTLHFFLGPVERKVPYQQQPNLVGSVYTFTAPFTTSRGGTGCSNCRAQASDGVLSHAQIPLTRSVPIEERQDPDKAMEYFQRELRWVAVFDTGAKIPSRTLPALEITLLLGKNQLEGGLKGLPKFGEYQPKEFDWRSAEL